MKRSQSRAMMSVGTSVFGISAAVRDLRAARAKGDKLLLLDAAVSLAAVLTGLAIAYRSLRSGDTDA